MPLPPNFPPSPYDILDPDARWLPDSADLLPQALPPLVQKLREAVKAFRDTDYDGATPTSRSLLKWWFCNEHWLPTADGTTREFRYYFAQREAIETIVYLYDVVKPRDSIDLLRYSSSGAVSPDMFDETWLRFVVKMATGSGKTKVLSLALAWCYFHKLYEADSKLARNFLIIAPNIIVLDRLKTDFDGLRIFHTDPVLPDNGHDGRNWRDDFQLTVHLQDEVRTTQPVGNIFLTNIHRVYSGDDAVPTPDDDNTEAYFLGKRRTGATTDSTVDLGMIVRDIDELAVFNDEAHHIHDPDMAWFKSIEDIHNKLKQKGGGLALQIDTTATPKHNNGAIFVQTVTDYPLVEAIAQNMVKHPVIPDKASRAALKEKQSSKFSEKYADYLKLGVTEWKKASKVHDKVNKKGILFVMTDDTKNCDDVAAYLENTYPELQDKVLVIHTKRNGEISESKTAARDKAELEKLRRQANDIDSPESPYRAIVSVLVLKEGWDVRNVTTIVGLRAYTAQSNILPEQTLGRGLRLMYPEDGIDEKLSVIGTAAFMEFVEGIEREGVTLERGEMGTDSTRLTPLVIGIDSDNPDKDIDALDIQFPLLTPRIVRDYDLLNNLNSKQFTHQKVPYRRLDDRKIREKITFRYMVSDKVSHRTTLDSSVVGHRSAIGYFSQIIVREMRLSSHYHIIYEKVKTFVCEDLFDRAVDLEDDNTWRLLADETVTKTVIDTFKSEINKLILQETGDVSVCNHRKVSDMWRFVVKQQEFVVAQKSVLDKIIGDSGLELKFAEFLEQCDDIVSYAKNYFAVGFKLDYIKASGDLANYYPDFLVKKSADEIYIVETKGLEDLDVPHKMERLKQWCADANQAEPGTRYGYVFVDHQGFEDRRPASFGELLGRFTKYQ